MYSIEWIELTHYRFNQWNYITIITVFSEWWILCTWQITWSKIEEWHHYINRNMISYLILLIIIIWHAALILSHEEENYFQTFQLLTAAICVCVYCNQRERQLTLSLNEIPQFGNNLILKMFHGWYWTMKCFLMKICITEINLWNDFFLCEVMMLYRHILQTLFSYNCNLHISNGSNNSAW